MIKKEKREKVYFGKIRDTAKIPYKRDEDAGYDIYPDFEEDYMMILPGETKLIPTGLCSAFSSDYVMVLKERSSTGTKGIGQRAGIIDSGYRGEWKVPVTNHNHNPVFISKLNKEETFREYCKIFSDKTDGLAESIFEKHVTILPYEKAIAQALFVPVPDTEVVELTADEIKAISSERGNGGFGSSGK